MGVQLTEIITPKQIEFERLSGKKIAIDALNSLYQFLSIIRQPTGEPLRDSQGRITSHLSGLFYRNVNLMEYGILPIYVFDGMPHALKGKVVEMRKEAREEADIKWKEALAEKKFEEARLYAQQSSRVTDEMLGDSKRLLEYLGIPWVQAPSEGEAQAAFMVARGDAWAVGSQDYDSLLFGSSRLVRNLAISGKRKMPRREVYVDVAPEIFHLEEVLHDLGMSREQLIDIAILIGTDYNPGGVAGIGPKRAHSLIKEFGSAEKVIEAKGITLDFDISKIRELFLNPETTESYSLEWHPPKDEIVQFLCAERDFSEERVKKAIEKLSRQQSSLDSWVG